MSTCARDLLTHISLQDAVISNCEEQSRRSVTESAFQNSTSLIRQELIVNKTNNEIDEQI